MVTTDLGVMRLEGDRKALRSIRYEIDEDSAQVTAWTDFEVEIGLLITKPRTRRSVPIMVFAVPTANDNFPFEVFGIRHLATQDRRVLRRTETNGRTGWRESSIISVDPDFQSDTAPPSQPPGPKL